MDNKPLNILPIQDEIDHWARVWRKAIKAGVNPLTGEIMYGKEIPLPGQQTLFELI